MIACENLEFLAHSIIKVLVSSVVFVFVVLNRKSKRVTASGEAQKFCQ